MRAAFVHAPADSVRPYLPDNYKVVEEDPSTRTCVIDGEDVAGWTLDGYVLPRLASGLIFGEEIEADKVVDPDFTGNNTFNSEA
jgi:hypothetical protein